MRDCALRAAAGYGERALVVGSQCCFCGKGCCGEYVACSWDRGPARKAGPGLPPRLRPAYGIRVDCVAGCRRTFSLTGADPTSICSASSSTTPRIAWPRCRLWGPTAGLAPRAFTSTPGEGRRPSVPPSPGRSPPCSHGAGAPGGGGCQEVSGPSCAAPGGRSWMRLCCGWCTFPALLTPGAQKAKQPRSPRCSRTWPEGNAGSS